MRLSQHARQQAEELATSGRGPSIQWQAKMELLIDDAIAYVAEGVRSSSPEVTMARAQLAQACTIGALALAVANTVGDLELPMSKIAEEVASIAGSIAQ